MDAIKYSKRVVILEITSELILISGLMNVRSVEEVSARRVI